MGEKMTCLRCDSEMISIGVEQIQLGQSSVFTGLWGNILAGALEVDTHICEGCGKVEFFAVGAIEDEDNIAQIQCPHCNKLHDMDDRKCPYCHKKLIII